MWNSITVSKMDGVVVATHAAGNTVNIRSRRQYALSFCLDDGRIVYSHNGNKYVSDRNAAILLPQGEDYSFTVERSGSFPVINFFASDSFNVKEHTVCRLQNAGAYLQDVERICKLWSIGADENSAELMSLLYGLLARLAREGKARHPVTVCAMEYLGENLFSPELSVSDIAAACSVSEVYLRRIFKEAYGIAPRQYIQERRIAYARELLRETRESVTEIAEACGFSSVYHFCRAFKLVQGVTPGEYRRSSSL